MRKPPEDLPEQGVRNPAGARVLQQAAFPRLVEKGNRPGRNFKLTGQMEEAQKVKVLQTFYVTHDVKCIRLQKPVGFSFEPGQAADVSINRPGWEDEIRPFTFTCLPEDDYLEFTIKIYPDHDGTFHCRRCGDHAVPVDTQGPVQGKSHQRQHPSFREQDPVGYHTGR
jgi:hypothetical protein